MCLTISLSATVALVCLYMPKVYIIVFHPDKNVRKLTMTATYRKGPNRQGTTTGQSLAQATVTNNKSSNHSGIYFYLSQFITFLFFLFPFYFILFYWGNNKIIKTTKQLWKRPLDGVTPHTAPISRRKLALFVYNILSFFLLFLLFSFVLFSPEKGGDEGENFDQFTREISGPLISFAFDVHY